MRIFALLVFAAMLFCAAASFFADGGPAGAFLRLFTGETGRPLLSLFGRCRAPRAVARPEASRGGETGQTLSLFVPDGETEGG